MFANSSERNSSPGFHQSFNVAYLLIRGYATCFTPMLRHQFGGEALGFNALAAIVIMLFYMTAHPHSVGLPNYFFFWWFALILQRLGHFTRRWRGVFIHSRYDGTPWFETFFPFLGPHVARLCEIGFCIWMITDLTPSDPGFALLVTHATIALFLNWIADSYLDNLRTQRMHDAVIEHQANVARWRRTF